MSEGFNYDQLLEQRGNNILDWNAVEYVRNNEQFLEWKHSIMNGRTSDEEVKQENEGPSVKRIIHLAIHSFLAIALLVYIL